jgi:hypothetical protein
MLAKMRKYGQQMRNAVAGIAQPSHVMSVAKNRFVDSQ